MNNLFLNNALRFIGLILLQVLVLNHINLFGHINPLVYIVWIFLFPVRKNITSFLIFSFLLGLSIDLFSDSGGINAAATLFIAFIRLPVLKAVLGKSAFDYFLFNLRSISFPKALIFISVLTFIHHFIIFGLEYFSFHALVSIFLNCILTSIFTIILTMISFTFVMRKR